DKMHDSVDSIQILVASLPTHSSLLSLAPNFKSIFCKTAIFFKIQESHQNALDFLAGLILPTIG
ncbi:MAG: hypothetical protein Q8P67_22475, partial [archaeon]|nr:hypothetical protein [archaeon]